MAGIALLLAGCSAGSPGPAEDVTNHSATLTGTVASTESDTDVRYWFPYGLTTAYDHQTPERTVHLPAGSSGGIPVSEPLGGLSKWTTYHYQLCTAPPRPSCLKADRAFTTGPAIVFVSDRAAPTSETGAVWRMDAGGHEPRRLSPSGVGDVEDVAASRHGTKIAFSTLHEIWVMDADGSHAHAIVTSPSIVGHPSWSPDGSRIAFSDHRTGSGDIYLVDADGTDPVRLTSNPDTAEELPSWSPDGTRIAFSDFNSDTVQSRVLTIGVNGTGLTLLSPAGALDCCPSWSRDGSKIAFSSSTDIWVMNADGSARVDLTPTTGAEEGSPAFSPDGSRIAFVRRSGANVDVWVMKANGTGATQLTDQPPQDGSPSWLVAP